MASGYMVGLNAQPKLYEGIYAQKQAKSDAAEAARQKEQSDKFAKDADKFRIDYSKIHRIYAPKAKGAVAEFMSTADELKQKYPHTYSNTEEYNNAYFKAVSELEDLQNYSKNIYGALEMRAKDVKDEFQTNPELVKALASGSLQDVQGLLGRENVELDDVLQKRFNEVEHQKFLNDAVGRAKLIDETSIKALGKGTNDYLITETDVIDKDNLKQVAQTAYNNDPAAQRDFTFDEYLKKAETWVAPKSQQLLRSLQAPKESGGYGATSEDWVKNATQPTTITYGATNEKVPSIANFTITETPATFSASEAIDLKTGAKYTGKVANGTLGQVHIIAVHKNTGLPATGSDFASNNTSDVEYRPMIVLTTDKDNKSLLVPASVGRGAAESKESKEEREALKSRLDWAQKKADKANEGFAKRMQENQSQSNKKFSQMTVSEKQAIVNTIPADIKSQGSAAITKWLKDNGY